MAPLIEMRKVTKEYRGVPAIKDVDFTLEVGEIHALVGENGAGKSTLTKIMAGVTGPTSGTMLFDGKPTAFQSPAEALGAASTWCSRKTAWCRRCRWRRTSSSATRSSSTAFAASTSPRSS